MASSYDKTVFDDTLEAIVQEYSKTASDSGDPTWRMVAVAGSAIAVTVSTSNITYSGTSITFGEVEIDIPADRTVTSIRLEYNDGGVDGNVIIDEQDIADEVYTYEGKYIVTSYTITFTS